MSWQKSTTGGDTNERNARNHGQVVEAIIAELEATEKLKRPAHEVIVAELEEACKRICAFGSLQAFENLRAGISALLKVFERMVVPDGVRSTTADELKRIMNTYSLVDLDIGVARELPESTSEKFARAILKVGPVPKKPPSKSAA